MPEVRAAQIADSVTINQLSVDLKGEILSKTEAEKRVETILLSATDHLWVFDDSGVVKGWIHLFVTHRVGVDTYAEIGGLVVSPKYRRAGIGRKLVMQTFAWARKKNLKIRVRCNVKREGSHEFYRSVGFSQIKSQHVFIAE